jgi:hypothetical protein
MKTAGKNQEIMIGPRMRKLRSTRAIYPVEAGSGLILFAYEEVVSGTVR